MGPIQPTLITNKGVCMHTCFGMPYLDFHQLISQTAGTPILFGKETTS